MPQDYAYVLMQLTQLQNYKTSLPTGSKRATVKQLRERALAIYNAALRSQ
jgi:hypothetical protein